MKSQNTPIHQFVSEIFQSLHSKKRSRRSESLIYDPVTLESIKNEFFVKHYHHLPVVH